MQKNCDIAGFQPTKSEALLNLMVRPQESVGVMIVAQSLNKGIENVQRIIDIWPNLKFITFVQDKDHLSLKEIDDTIDIILVDEPLEQITGSEVVEILGQLLFLGIFASIKSDDCPNWAKFHFGGKNALYDSEQANKMFIAWMNKLIDEVEAIRLH